MSELPPGWAFAGLGQVANYINGRAFKPSEWKKEGVPIVRIQNLTNSSNSFNYTDDQHEAKYRLKNGDLLIAWSASLGAFIWNSGDAWLNQHIFRVEPFTQIVSKDFLYYAVKTAISDLYDKAHGTGMVHVTKPVFESHQIRIPPLNEQRRIVAKLEKLLSRVDAAQARLAAIPRILKRFRQSVLAAACSGRLTADWRETNTEYAPVDNIIDSLLEQRLDAAETARQESAIRAIYDYSEENDSESLPEGWKFVALDKLCLSFNYGTSSKSQAVGRIPVLRMGNIQNGEIDWSDLVYTSNADEIAKYHLAPRTVLFNRTNSPELVGKTAIYRGELAAVFAGYLIRINNFGVLDSDYLNYCLNTRYAKDYCLAVKTDGVSQSNINAQKLAKFEVPFSSLAEQQEIVRRVEKLFKTADALEARYRKAEARVAELTQSILAKAFRGELVPQDPKDEPASVLLERIREQRNAKPTKKPKAIGKKLRK